MAVGVTWAVRRQGIEVEQATVRIGIAIVGVGQAIVRVRHGRARRRRLVDAGMRRLAVRAARPSVFCRRERSPTQQQGRSDRDQG